MPNDVLPSIQEDIKYAYAGDMPTILAYCESREVSLRQAFMNFWYKKFKTRAGCEYFEVNEEKGTMSFDVSFLDNSEESKFDVYLFKIIEDRTTEDQQILMISYYPFVWAD
jgi:hypothetical protein